LVAFLDLLAANYGAGMRLVDFENAPEEARVAINDWVSEQTEGRIEELIPQGLIDRMTTLVLTNAVYFNAAWSQPFDPELTQDGAFYPLDGAKVTVPMMRQTASLPYAEGDGYQAVEMAYDGNELSMVILLPATDRFETFESSLDAARVEGILQGLGYREVALTMPKFEFDAEFQLKEVLASMGMPVAFSGEADFSGMTGNRELFISEVVHKAFVAVDEAGTEAAAATAVIIAKSALPAEPVEMTVDRPFLFFIRDLQTGTVLFVGRVMDPTT
jgi:serpin B